MELIIQPWSDGWFTVRLFIKQSGVEVLLCQTNSTDTVIQLVRKYRMFRITMLPKKDKGGHVP